MSLNTIFIHPTVLLVCTVHRMSSITFKLEVRTVLGLTLCSDSRLYKRIHILRSKKKNILTRTTGHLENMHVNYIHARQYTVQHYIAMEILPQCLMKKALVCYPYTDPSAFMGTSSTQGHMTGRIEKKIHNCQISLSKNLLYL